MSHYHHCMVPLKPYTHDKPNTLTHTLGQVLQEILMPVYYPPLKLTVLFQAVPVCSIKVYSPCTAFKDKGGSAIHSCGGGGRHLHERVHMEIFWWDNAFTRYANNWLTACVYVCGSCKGSIPAIFCQTPRDVSITILSNEMQIFWWWSDEALQCIIASPYSCVLQVHTQDHKSLNNMNNMIRTVNFSILMSRIQSIWSWPVSTHARLWGGLGEEFTYVSGGVAFLWELPTICRGSWPVATPVPQWYRTETQGFVATGRTPCFHLLQNWNFHIIWEKNRSQSKQM